MPTVPRPSLFRFIGAALLIPWAATGLLFAQPIPVVFDTDMGNDVDDALALAMLHALADRNEIELLSVTLTKDNALTVPFIDLLNTFYGRPNVPVGVNRSGITPADHAMLRAPVEKRRSDGAFVYPRDLGYDDAPAAVRVLREALAEAPDTSVVIVQVGFSTNLADLLRSPPDSASRLSGAELASKKVRLLSLMAGNFDHSKADPEYNVVNDISSAQIVFENWPSPIVVSGFEIGLSVLFPASSIERDFAYVEHHPVVDAYRNYLPMPYDRPTWDLTSVLAAVRPEADYFDLSAPGVVKVDDQGYTAFRRTNGGRHRFLRFKDDAQRKRVLEALVLLSSQPPVRR